MELSLSTFISAFIYYITYIYSNLYPYGNNPDFNVKETPQNQILKEYDIIILGSSSAGCVLANRLTEIPSLSVLIMSRYENENGVGDNPLLFRLDGENNRTGVPQSKSCLAQGGRCPVITSSRLGGISASNDMFYLRGTEEDYNLWAKEGNTDWNWNNVFPYFLKMENYKIKPMDKSPYHGTKGPLTVRYPRYKTLLRQEYIKAGIEFGFPQNDFNGRTQYGIDYSQLLLDGPTRLSAAQAYLNPIIKRKNIDFVRITQIPKILINKANKQAEGVEYTRDGRSYTVKAKREVIVSMGTLYTAQTLILNGIGPREELRRLGIPQICDLPVGSYFQDQPSVDVYFEINKPFTITTRVWRSNTSVIDFGNSGEGPLTFTGEEANAFFNSLDRNSTSTNAVLSFLSWYPFTNKLSQNRQIITVRLTMLNPRSFGNVTLRSNNPDDFPLVNHNFFQVEYDYAVLEAAAKTAIEFMKTPTMMKYSPKLVTDFQPKCKGKNVNEFIKCIVPNYTFGISAGTGTARMGSVVTQDQLFVRGIKSLRVVDDSVIPYMIRGSPLMPTMMIAERTADLIKNFYGIKKLENPIYPSDYNFTAPSNIHTVNNYAPWGLFPSL